MLRVLLILTLFIFINKYGLCHDHNHDHNAHEKPFAEDDDADIDEHLAEFSNKKASDLSREEKLFYQFKLHDSNNDTLLDGLEILYLIGSSTLHEHNNMTLNELIEMTDYALQSYDVNFDGYVTYAEIHEQT